MEQLNWNEVQLLRGLIFKELDQEIGQLTKQDLTSALEKLDARRIELQIEMEKDRL